MIKATSRRSILQPLERVHLLAYPVGVGQAALPFRELDGLLERGTRLLDPSCTFEHRREVLVPPRLQPQVLRLGLRDLDAAAGKRLGLLALAVRGEKKRRDAGAEHPVERAGRKRRR